jgi:hypothetical protein
MEYQLYRSILAALAVLVQPRPRRSRATYPDDRIAAVYLWAVLHDRPTRWACDRRHWPIHLRADPLPSAATLSRRLRTASVRALLVALERHANAPTAPGVFWLIDGKPLPIGGASRDPHAGFGRAAGGMAKGYKLHLILGGAGAIAAWRLAPMNTDERVMARRMVGRAGIAGYLVGDTNYDSNPLHAVCDRVGELQLLAPRRRGGALGRHRHALGRVRAVERMENPRPLFADRLHADRSAIEREFSRVTSGVGGLQPLPSFVRTYPRVFRWVQAKLAIAGLRRA